MLTEAKRVHKTFLFTDVVKSTDIRAACIRELGDIGNERFDNQVVVPHDEILDRLIAEFNGEIVSTEGDSYFVVFNSSQSAVQCAVAIQSAFIERRIPLPVIESGLPPSIQVRIGLHTGGARELLRAGRPNYSDHTINIAARIKSLANGEQVLMSEDTWNNAGRLNGIIKKEWRNYKLKGVDGVWTLIEALWGQRRPSPPQVSPAAMPPPSVAMIEAFNVFGGRVEILTDELLSHPASPKRIQQFYSGAKLDWDIIAAHGDIPRDQEEALLKQASEPFQEMRLICLVAEAGAGKSTLAWRTAAELHTKHGAVVMRIKDSRDADVWYRLPEFCAQLGRPFYVLVDDIFQNPDAVSAFCELNPWLPVAILATSRRNEYRVHRLKCETSLLDLKEPSLFEKRRILKRLGKSLNDLTVEQRRRLDDANQFLVLMIEVTQGKELHEIVRDTLERLYELDEAGYRAYEYICLAYQHSVQTPITLLERLDDQARFHNLPERETTQGLIFWDSGESRVRAGHSVIAKTAAKFYAQHHSPQAALEEIAAAVDTASFDERWFVECLLLVLANSNSPALTSMPKTLERMIARYAQSAERISELIIMRSLYLRLGQREQAEGCKERALVLEPVSSADCNLLVNLFRERGHPHEALPMIARWVNEHSEWSGVGPAYMRLTESYGTANDIKRLLQEMDLWLSANTDDTHVRGPFLGLVERHGAPGQIAHLITDTRAWLVSHPDDRAVRTAYMGLVESKGTPAQLAQLIADTSVWLVSHPNDNAVRTAFLGLAERKGTPEQVAQLIADTSTWMAVHREVRYVRRAYLGLVERKGTPVQLAHLITEANAWLVSHPDDDVVRTAYLGLIERRGAPAQVAQVITETSAWLASHADDLNVRIAYLKLAERKGAAEQVAQVITETSAWLASHADDDDVRIAYLKLAERKGTAEQVAQVITETSAWLASHADDDDVRIAYLKLAERKATAEQVAQVITETSAWLASQADDLNVRIAYLKLAERKGTAEQVGQIITTTSAWLKEPVQQDNEVVREFYLRLVKRKGATVHVEQVAEEIKAWLTAHPDDIKVRVAWLNCAEAIGSTDLKEKAISETKSWLLDHLSAKEVWRALLSWLSRTSRGDEAVELTVTAMSVHRNARSLLGYYLRAVQDNADDQKVRSIFEEWMEKYPKDSDLQNRYAAWLRDREYYGEAEERYRSRIENAPRDPQARYGYGLLLLQSERLGEAAAQFEEALNLHRGHRMAHDGLARTFWKLGDFEHAEQEFRKAVYWGDVRKEPLAKLYADLGWFYVDRARWSDALGAFESARDEDPDHFGNYWGIGRALYEMSDYAAAADALRVAQEKEPDLQPPASAEISRLLDHSLDRFRENHADDHNRNS